MLDLLQDFFDINVTGLQPSSKDLEMQVAETNPVCYLFAGAGAYLWYSFLAPFTSLPVDMLSSSLMWTVEQCAENIPFILAVMSRVILLKMTAKEGGRILHMGLTASSASPIPLLWEVCIGPKLNYPCIGQMSFASLLQTSLP